MGKNKQFDFKIIKEVGVLSEGPRRRKVVRLISWNNRPARIDIRSWFIDKDDVELPTKGLTFTYSELNELKKLIDECIELVSGKQIEPLTVKGSAE